MRVLQLTDLHLSTTEDGQKNTTTFIKAIDYLVKNREDINV